MHLDASGLFIILDDDDIDGMGVETFKAAPCGHADCDGEEMTFFSTLFVVNGAPLRVDMTPLPFVNYVAMCVKTLADACPELWMQTLDQHNGLPTTPYNGGLLMPVNVAVACPVHGQLAVAEIDDTEQNRQAFLSSIATTHAASYGANCDAPLTVTDLDDEETATTRVAELDAFLKAEFPDEEGEDAVEIAKRLLLAQRETIRQANASIDEDVTVD